MKNICTVTVYDPERKKEWEAILGTNTVPAKSIIPSWGNFPIVGRQEYYECDLDRLTPEQKDKLIKHISNKFNLQEDAVKRDIDKMGVPILTKDCVVADDMRKYL